MRFFVFTAWSRCFAIDLITSRVEGEAIGILMAQHRSTEEEAVGLLRRLSWTSQRTLHEAAADMVRTTNLQRRPECYIASPARREQRPGAVEVEPWTVR